MGRSASRRAARNFRKDPLANSCYTLSVLSLTAGVLGLFAVFGGADCLVFAIGSLLAGVLLILAGRKLGKRKKG